METFGYHLVMDQIESELPEDIKILRLIFNVVLRLGYFPSLKKMAQILTISFQKQMNVIPEKAVLIDPL